MLNLNEKLELQFSNNISLFKGHCNPTQNKWNFAALYKQQWHPILMKFFFSVMFENYYNPSNKKQKQKQNNLLGKP